MSFSKISLEDIKNCKNTYFTDGVYVEKVNAKKLNALLKSNGLLLENDWLDDNTEWSDFETSTKQLTEYKFLKKIQNKLCLIDGNYYLKTTYFSRKDYARVYPSGAISLSTIRRPLRHFLCDEMYYDIDMVNAHPNILLSLCKSNNVRCKLLGEYCEKREQIIKRMIKINSKLSLLYNL